MYKRYVDGTFLLFRSEHVEKFKNYFNNQYKNIAFITEIEQNGLLQLLKIKISCESNKFVTSVYQKSTFSRFLTNFESFISKSSLI